MMFRKKQGNFQVSTDSHLCYVCRKPKHKEKDCPEMLMEPEEPQSWQLDSSQKICFSCGMRGHLSFQCDVKTSDECHKCKKTGHWARDCPFNSSRYEEKSEFSCYNCNMTGHYARNCPTMNNQY